MEDFETMTNKELKKGKYHSLLEGVADMYSTLYRGDRVLKETKDLFQKVFNIITDLDTAYSYINNFNKAEYALEYLSDIHNTAMILIECLRTFMAKCRRFENTAKEITRDEE